MKQLSWQLVTVIVVGIVGAVATIGFLSAAGWSEAGIAGMVTLMGTVVTGLVMQLKGQQTTNARIADLDRKTDTVVAQTNGLSDIERQDIAQRAAVLAARDIYNREKH